MPALETLRDNVPFAWRYARSWLYDLADELLSIQGGVPPTQSYITLTGQAVAPTAPAIGDYKLYFTNTGLLRSIDGSSVVREYVDLSNTQTITGAKTFSATLTTAAITASGDILVSKTAATSTIFINANAGQFKILRYQSAGLSRWAIFSNNTAEGGSDAGSDLNITRYSDAGAPISNVVTIIRSNGNTTFVSPIFTVSNGGGTANITVSASTSPSLILTGATTNAKTIFIRTSGSNRWHFGANATAESGGNAGSDLVLVRYDDAGVVLGSPITIIRSTGQITLSQTVTLTGTLDHDGGLVGFYAAAPIAKPTVTGSRGGNAALASFLTAMANLGLITDSTTA